jgi:hypothetical protein
MGLDEETLKKLASAGLPHSRPVTVTINASDEVETWLTSASASACRLLKEGSATTLCHSLETQRQRATSLVGSLTRYVRICGFQRWSRSPPPH